MKRKIYFIIIGLITIMSGLLIYSCNKQENGSNKEENNFTPKKIGMLHNKYLALCRQNNLYEKIKLNTKSINGGEFMPIIEFLAQQEEVKDHLKDVNLEEIAIFCENLYNEIKDKTADELESHVNGMLKQETKSQNYRAEVYNSVYKESLEFWANIRPQTKDENNRKVVLADGFAGLAGLLFGGVGCAITAPAMSYLVDKHLEQEENELIGPPSPY